MLRLWNYIKNCVFGNKLKLVDELIEIIDTESKIAEAEKTPDVTQPKPRKTRKKKTDVSTDSTSN